MSVGHGMVAALWLMLATGGAMLSGCDENDGPLEQAGEKADEAIKDAERAVEDATD